MQNTPKVSIIIPVFNGVNYLGEAIDSALAQSYQSIEVIVINDGSNDDGQTERLALSYGSKIRYFQKENGGVASALNLGIQKMTGDFFSWLSHDDLYYPDKIKLQVEFYKKAAVTNTVFYCDNESIDEYGIKIQSAATKKNYNNNAILLILSASLHGCSLLVPRAAFYKVGLFNDTLRNTQDVEMWLRLALAGYQFQRVPTVMVQGRIHRAQTTRTTQKRHVKEAKDFFHWALKTIDIELLLKNKKDVLKILCKKNQPTAACHFMAMLQKNNELRGMYTVLGLGFLSIIRKNITNKLNLFPGYITFTYTLRNWLARIPTINK